MVLPGDLALRKAVQTAFQLDHLPCEQDVLDTAGKWRCSACHWEFLVTWVTRRGSRTSLTLPGRQSPMSLTAVRVRALGPAGGRLKKQAVRQALPAERERVAGALVLGSLQRRTWFLC